MMIMMVCACVVHACMHVCAYRSSGVKVHVWRSENPFQKPDLGLKADHQTCAMGLYLWSGLTTWPPSSLC